MPGLEKRGEIRIVSSYFSSNTIKLLRISYSTLRSRMARTKNPARLNTDPHPYPGRNRQKYSEMAQRAENMTPMGYLATKSALYRVPEADHPGPSQPKDTLIALGYPGTPPSPHPVPESSSAPFQNFAHVPYYPAPVFKWKTPLLPNPNFDHSNADREPPAGKIPPILVPVVNPEPSQKMTRSVNTPDTTMGSVNASDVHMETGNSRISLIVTTS